MSGIYQIRNLINNYIYIGSALDLTKRHNKHVYDLKAGRHINRHLQSSWNKYVETNFVFEILITCDQTMLLWYEQQFIDQWKPEYNKTPTAGSQLGYRHSASAKKKIRDFVKANHPNLGKHLSKYTIDKISKSNSGKKRTDEQKIRISNAKKIFYIENGYPYKYYPGFVSPDGIEYRDITNLKQFCLSNNLNYAGMCRLGRLERNQYKGWKVI